MIARLIAHVAWRFLLYAVAGRYLSRRLAAAAPPGNEEPMERAFAPHCDSSVLHAPGTCQSCDMYPDWQHYRRLARISFTGDDPGDLAPCPSEWFRPADRRDAWPGNRP